MNTKLFFAAAEVTSKKTSKPTPTKTIREKRQGSIYTGDRGIEPTPLNVVGRDKWGKGKPQESKHNWRPIEEVGWLGSEKEGLGRFSDRERTKKGK